MKIIRDLSELKEPFHNAVVTLGNFDGVHLGHREIFRTVVRTAKQKQGTSIVCTFNPHPLKMLSPQHAPRLINTAAERERLIAASCLDALLIFPFTRELSALSPEEFVDDILLARVGMKHLIVGYDYAFGRGRSGSIEFLRQQGKEKGFTVDVFGPMQKSGHVLSSTRVRQAILSGDVEGAVGLLGRHFNLEGDVVHGDGRGHSLGFATANIVTDKELLPCSGVYAAMVRHDGQDYKAVVNIGCKPTFGEHPLTIEVHLLDFDHDLYGKKLRVYFVKRLRGEKTFADGEALIAAIRQDVDRAIQCLESVRIIEYREYLEQGSRRL
ncbi:MAG: bifunctional riboflavin kinase/FAD synthetase [Desulfuromonas sp.]|nr:bifunctional riboflavin kinase/FAD synthetase [Desulfuromonas sp.]